MRKNVDVTVRAINEAIDKPEGNPDETVDDIMDDMFADDREAHASKLDALLDKARLELIDRNVQKSTIAELDGPAKEQFEHEGIRTVYALCLAALKDKRAPSELAKALSLAPDQSELYFAIGRQAESKQTKEAQQEAKLAFRRGLKVWEGAQQMVPPRKSDAYYSLGKLSLKGMRPEEAPPDVVARVAASWQHAIAVDPTNVEVHRQLAHILSASEMPTDQAAARASGAAAIRLAPAQAASHFAHARAIAGASPASLSTDELDSAVEAVRTGLRLKHGSSVRGRADAYLHLGDLLDHAAAKGEAQAGPGLTGDAELFRSKLAREASQARETSRSMIEELENRLKTKKERKDFLKLLSSDIDAPVEPIEPAEKGEQGGALIVGDNLLPAIVSATLLMIGTLALLGWRHASNRLPALGCARLHYADRSRRPGDRAGHLIADQELWNTLRPALGVSPCPDGQPLSHSTELCQVTVVDACRLPVAPTLASHGFELRCAPSKAKARRGQRTGGSEDILRAEAEDAVRAATGADLVHAFHVAWRSSRCSETETLVREAGSHASRLLSSISLCRAPYTTDATKRKLSELIASGTLPASASAGRALGDSSRKTHRVMICTVTRLIEGGGGSPSIVFLEPSSVAPADSMPYILSFGDESCVGATLTYSPAHRWHAYSAVSPDDLLICADYEETYPSPRQVFHAAFDFGAAANKDDAAAVEVVVVALLPIR
jgi:tetratricopeptide (TPR) repeat protein